MTYIIKNYNGYHYIFWVKLSSSGTSGIVGRRCVMEIQEAAK